MNKKVKQVSHLLKTSRRHRIAVAVACLLLVFGLVTLLHQMEMGEKSTLMPVNPWMLLPFILLLLAIALAPFISSHWWEQNYAFVSFGLGAIALFYYLFILKNGPRITNTALEYFSFIALIGSLFVVSGGIHIRIKGRSTPYANVILLGIGSVIANIFGTTGASMILIRPYIRTNKYRISKYHIVFFIFIVSNMGGLLTPVGDPPLFLGYLKGIPFFWILGRTLPIWLLSNAMVLLIFYLIDRHSYSNIPLAIEHEIEEKGEEARILGYNNLGFLAIILFAVFLNTPIREMLMIGAAFASYLTTRDEIHHKNDFNFFPIKEVAILFAGIFATMLPVLDWLQLNAGRLGVTQPAQFYWASGILSSFLDNAPTYLNFLSAAAGLHGLDVDNAHHIKALIGLLPASELSQIQNSISSATCMISSHSWKFVQAISAGAVMFGANTYIGNGPNFMVKSIAEHANIKMPSFFGYIIKYSIPILLPIFVVIWFIFFRG